MAHFSVIQAGGSLQLLDESGTLTTLTLPAGVTLRSDVPARFVVNDRYVVLVNTPSRPLSVDSTGKVRVLSPTPPRVAAVLSGVSGGTLSGTYAGVRYTFVLMDTSGNIIYESDFSPASNSVVISTQFLRASNLDLSPDEISVRRLYRPVSGGVQLFDWIDLDGNILTSIQDDLSDASLSLVATTPTLGMVPHLTLIAEYRQRLFGVADDDIDTVRYAEAGQRYAWPAVNAIPVGPIGADDTGITALMARREALGVGRRNHLWQITGTTPDDFTPVKITENCGVMSQECVATYRDTVYFLWEDGVYQWGADGLTCLSDGSLGRGRVRRWFTTNDYFNRNRFKYAFGVIDPVLNRYRLYLASAGSSVEDTWVEFDLKDRTWWGPHSTSAFTPTAAFSLTSDEAAAVEVPEAVVGSLDGNLYIAQTDANDAGTDAIDFGLVTRFLDNGDPDRKTYWGELSVLSNAVQTGGTFTVTPSIGDSVKQATAQPAIPASLALGRNRLRRIGEANVMQLLIEHSEINKRLEIQALEIEPVRDVARR